MIVIDVGCATWGGDESVNYLIENYGPQTLYGFDPGLDWPVDTEEKGTHLILSRSAAWTHDGKVGFTVANLGGHVEDGAVQVPCIDLARFILELPDDDIILKMDAEGAEYTLIPHLVTKKADLRLDLFMVEWHCEVCGHGIWKDDHPAGCEADMDWWNGRRSRMREMLNCPQRDWNR